ncbi:MAG: hypothetical protein ACRDPR_00690 [Nocardioidaceae bacterium]
MRSEPKAPPAGDAPEDILVAVVIGLVHALLQIARSALLIGWWSVLFPMLSVPVALTVWSGVALGSVEAVVVGSVSAVALAGWRLRAPASFRCLVSEGCGSGGDAGRSTGDRGHTSAPCMA